MSVKHLYSLSIRHFPRATSRLCSTANTFFPNVLLEKTPGTRYSSNAPIPDPDTALVRFERAWSTSELEELKKMSKQELPLRAIAAKLGRTLPAVTRCLVRLSNPLQRQSSVSIRAIRSWTADEVEKLRKMAQQGLSTQAIAASLGRTYSSTRAKYRQLMTPTTVSKTGPWSIQEHQQNLAMKLRGESNATIAAALGRSEAAIRTRNNAGLQHTYPHNIETHHWSENELASLLRLKHEGKTYQEIAAALPGRTYNAVVHRCHESHLITSTRLKGFWMAQELQKLKELYMKGVPHHKIAAELGRSLKSVNHKLINTGISTRTALKWTSNELELLMQLREQGLTFTEIAAHLPGRTASACSKTHYNKYRCLPQAKSLR